MSQSTGSLFRVEQLGLYCGQPVPPLSAPASLAEQPPVSQEHPQQLCLFSVEDLRPLRHAKSKKSKPSDEVVPQPLPPQNWYEH